MGSLLLLFIILSSGGLFCAAKYDKKYEEILPVTCSAVVLILFVCGIGGWLEAGVWLVCGLSLVLCLFSGIWLVKSKNVKTTVRNFFTPAFFVFLVLFCSLVFLNRGKLADGWDEFSHWADIVKVMTTLDDFGTNPESHSAFQSYPPGMSLFQYFVQKINLGVNPSALFSEWRLYFAYQIFFISFMMPFLKEWDFKKTFLYIAAVFAMLISPLLFYSDIYTKIYIDPFLGVLSGTGLAAVFLCKKKDIFYSLRILFTCSMLVLAKDAGMLFALILAIAYIADYLYENREQVKTTGVRRWRYLSCILCGIAAVALPKILWEIHLQVTKAARNFASPIEWDTLLQVLIGADDTYRTGVWNGFLWKTMTTSIPVGNTGIYLNYLVLIFVFLLLLSMLYKVYRGRDVYYSSRLKWLAGLVLAQTVIYMLGLNITYMFKFSEYEATIYASFSRYMNIAFFAAWLVLVLLILTALLQYYYREQYLGVLILVSVIIAISPMEAAWNFIQRTPVNNSINMRAEYETIVNKINSAADGNSRVYFIAQTTQGFEHWVVRFSARPNIVGGSWSIGEPFYEGDIWTAEMSAEEWQKVLLEGDYDLVAIYLPNEYIVENFSSLFVDEIEGNTVYQINKETGLLEKCE